MGKTFKVICAWYGKVIGECQDCEGDSHGMCEKCYAKWMKEVEKLGEKGKK